MASDIANDIVNKVFADDKSGAIDAIQQALNAKSYEDIQAKKIEFAQTWGFDPEKTAQATADELTDQLPDNTDIPDTADTAVAVAQAEQEDSEPVDEVTPEPEETTDETNQWRNSKR